MIKALQQVLVYTAWGILFAHSIVPHAHELDDELKTCVTRHEHDSSLLDTLSHIFHFSTGEDHLEDFSKGTGLQLALVPDRLHVACYDVDLVTQALERTQKPLSKGAPLIYGLRAPPFRH